VDNRNLNENILGTLYK